MDNTTQNNSNTMPVFPPPSNSPAVLPPTSSIQSIPTTPAPSMVNQINNEPKPQFQTSSIQDQPPTNGTKPVPETSAAKPDVPTQTPEIPTGFESKQNFTKQSIIGGIEEQKPKSKAIFSLPSMGSGSNKPDQPSEQDKVEQAPPPAYNEVTAPGVRSKFAIIAIVIGAVLLVAAGSGYYYMSYVKKQDNIENTQPVVEQSTVPEVVEDSTIDTDPYVVQFSQLEASSSIEPAELKKQIQSLDLQSIDIELSPQVVEMEQVQPTTTEPDPALQ